LEDFLKFFQRHFAKEVSKIRILSLEKKSSNDLPKKFRKFGSMFLSLVIGECISEIGLDLDFYLIWSYEMRTLQDLDGFKFHSRRRWIPAFCCCCYAVAMPLLAGFIFWWSLFLVWGHEHFYSKHIEVVSQKSIPTFSTVTWKTIIRFW